MEEYRRILESNPGFGVAHYGLAIGYLNKGEVEAAERHYGEALRNNYPADEELAGRIETLKKG